MDDNLPWLLQMWRYSRSLVHFTLLTILGMGLWTLLEFAAKGATYVLAVWQTRRFLKTCASLFEQGNWQQALALAETRKQSHVANVISRGLRAYRGVHAVLPLSESAEVAERQARVAANRLHEQMREGLGSLGSIATTAPLVALFGTLVGILDSFVGVGMERGTYLSFICTRLALALSTTAAGLVVAILALGCFNWLSERLSMLDAEMRIARLELRKYLDRQRS